MTLTIENAIEIEIDTLDFPFIMHAMGVFDEDGCELEDSRFETLDGAAFTMVHDSDIDAALEVWITASLESLAYQMHDAWRLDCVQAGYEVEPPSNPFGF